MARGGRLPGNDAGTLVAGERPSARRGRGAPKGNRNAERHGLYSRRLSLTIEELGDLATADAAPPGLADEINLLRVLIGRVAGDKSLSDADRLEVVGRAASTLATLVKAHAAVSGDRGDELADHLLAALGVLGQELGLAL